KTDSPIQAIAVTTWAQRSSRLAQSSKYEPIRVSSEGRGRPGRARTPQDPLTTAGSVRLEGHVCNGRTLQAKRPEGTAAPAATRFDCIQLSMPMQTRDNPFPLGARPLVTSARPGKQPGCLHILNKLYTLLNP